MVIMHGRNNNTGRRADFEPFAASFFAPHLYTGIGRAGVGCGAGALALITGVPPEKVAAEHVGNHYADSFMVRFLNRRGYRVLSLTPFSIVGAHSKIGTDHVVLISQLFRRYEATWGVIFGNTYYHNFDSYSLSGLAFLNKPILSAYLVVHPTWRIAEQPKPTATAVKSRGGPRLKLRAIRKGAEFSWRREWS